MAIIKQFVKPGGKQPIVIRPECHTICHGDLVVAALLSQVVFWYLPNEQGQSKLRVHRHGVWWIAKTRAKWMEETGLTLEQYKRALNSLKRKDLIEVRKMRFGGDAISHIRLLHSIAGALVGNPPTGWSKTHQPVGGSYANQELSTEIQTESTSGSVICGEKATADPDEDPQKTPGVEAVGEEQIQYQKEEHSAGFVKGWLMKASEILNRHKAPTTGSLGAYWKSRCALVQGTHQHMLTAKENAQLKQLSKYLGAQTRPVIDYAVNNWWKFASEAGALGGVQAPGAPHIGFLLAHYHVAVNLLAGGVSVSPVPTEMPVSVPQPPKMESEDVHTLTSQELTKLLDELKTP